MVIISVLHVYNIHQFETLTETHSVQYVILYIGTKWIFDKENSFSTEKEMRLLFFV